MSSEFGEACFKAYFGVASRICFMFKKCFYITGLRRKCGSRSWIVICCVCVVIVYYSDPDNFFSASILFRTIYDLQAYDRISNILIVAVVDSQAESGHKTSNINDSFLNLTNPMPQHLFCWWCFVFACGFILFVVRTHLNGANGSATYYRPVWLPRGCKRDLCPFGNRHS